MRKFEELIHGSAQVARFLGIAIRVERQGALNVVFVGPDASEFNVMVGETTGDLVPDGFHGDTDPDYCKPALWKSAVCAELMVAVRCTIRDVAYLEYARKVFSGEVVHPSVAREQR